MVRAEAGAVPLGLLALEGDRALVVISSDGEPAVGLRESVDRARVVVKDARPGEALHVLRSCRPWPWLVVGSVAEPPSEMATLLAAHPVVVLWLGPAPGWLPAHRRAFSRFSALAAAVVQALHNEVEGMRLATGAGVEFSDGRISRSAELQALVSAHPDGFDLSLNAFRSAARILAGHCVALRPRRDPATGLVSLR
jgi:hypothetical protein